MISIKFHLTAISNGVIVSAFAILGVPQGSGYEEQDQRAGTLWVNYQQLFSNYKCYCIILTPCWERYDPRNYILIMKAAPFQ